MKLSSEESKELNLYDGDIVFTYLNEEVPEKLTGQMEDGLLYLEPFTAAEIEKLPSDTMYGVEILSSAASLLAEGGEGDALAEKTSVETLTFDDGSTKARGIIETGARLSLKGEQGYLTIGVTDENDEKIAGVTFKLVREEDLKSVSGTTNSHGTISLQYTGLVERTKTKRATLYMDGMPVAKYDIKQGRYDIRPYMVVSSYADSKDYEIVRESSTTTGGRGSEAPVLYI